MGVRHRNDAQRWEARPVAGAVVRVLSFVIPVAVSVGVAWALTSTLPLPTTWPSRVLTIVGVLLASTLSLAATERYARRLLPLSALLRLSLAFPDEAPSRYRIARSAGRVRDIEAQVAEARANGVSDEPTRAAEQLLELVAALSRHDRATRGHAERTRVFVDMIAEEMALPQEDRDRLRWAALLHDIGKLEVPAALLNKPGKPDVDEWKVLRSHPAVGSQLAAPLLPFLGEWAATIADHHERFDGTGYPVGRAGADISLGGRIVAVADAFEVMTAARTYKEPMPALAARDELARCAGSHFDPAVVRAFLSVAVGRLRWTIGPVAWLAQSPVLLRFGSRAMDVATTAARVTTAAAVGVTGLTAGGVTLRPFAEPQGLIVADAGTDGGFDMVVPPHTADEQRQQRPPAVADPADAAREGSDPVGDRPAVDVDDDPTARAPVAKPDPDEAPAPADTRAGADDATTSTPAQPPPSPAPEPAPEPPTPPSPVTPPKPVPPPKPVVQEPPPAEQDEQEPDDPEEPEEQEEVEQEEPGPIQTLIETVLEPVEEVVDGLGTGL